MTGGSVIAIGDVHGQAEQLASLLSKLEARAHVDQRMFVFLGDFVDRGPNSRRVLDQVIALRSRYRVAAVMGNHDFAVCAALRLVETPRRNGWASRWIASYQADATFASYGVRAGDLPGLRAATPVAHKRFLAQLPWVVEHRDYLFVHAGLLPRVPLARQLVALRRRDARMNRPPWLCDARLARTPVPADCRQTLVSGHVRVGRVEFGDRRILLDTTGGTGGVLSAVLLPENDVIPS